MSGDASTYFKAGLKYRLYVFENFKPGERFRVASRSKSRMPGELLVAESLMHAQVASKSFRGKLLLTPTCSRNLDVRIKLSICPVRARFPHIVVWGTWLLDGKK